MTIEVNLSELTRGEVFNLSGHERGSHARTLFKLDEADASAQEVQVVIPAEVYTLTPSFFQGMFARSLQSLGNDRDSFFKKYRFRASPLILRQVDRGIAAVRVDRGPDAFAH